MESLFSYFEVRYVVFVSFAYRTVQAIKMGSLQRHGSIDMLYHGGVWRIFMDAFPLLFAKKRQRSTSWRSSHGLFHISGGVMMV